MRLALLLLMNAIYIAAINPQRNLFEFSDQTYWRPMNIKEVQDWRAGDSVKGVRSRSCGYDPNAYLVEDIDQQESACMVHISR
jgi:hypothetical protein